MLKPLIRLVEAPKAGQVAFHPVQHEVVCLHCHAALKGSTLSVAKSDQRPFRDGSVEKERDNPTCPYDFTSDFATDLSSFEQIMRTRFAMT
ncbi:MAG TPA: hypothetical protein VJB98_02380 [Candidatus Paceibacterota bacterium]